MDINFIVDQEKCINCKKCVADCPVLIIDGKTPFPEIKEGKAGNCLKCQHCLAVCPQAAISIWGRKPEDSIPTSSPIADTVEMANLMKLRRSVRRFTKEELSKDLIKDLLVKASYAPTAKNENAVQMTVVDSMEQMEKVRDLTYNAIKKVKEEGRLAEKHANFGNFQGLWEAKNIDILFRNAPHLLIVSNPKGGTKPIVDATIAVTYFDLLANSMGIATLWNGFNTIVYDEVVPEVAQQLGVPEDHKVVMVLSFGKPAVKYARSIQNEEPNIKILDL